MIGYTRKLAVDSAARGVRANSICPGFIVTDLNRGALEKIEADPEQKVVFHARNPLGLGRPSDVAYATWFLCSEEARWITGVDLSVDGGYTTL